MFINAELPGKQLYTLKLTEALLIRDEDGNTTFGGDQNWYSAKWHKQAGCGPTNGAHLISYLSQTRGKYSILTLHDCRSKTGFTALMEDVWHYMTPGIRGVNKTKFFNKSLCAYANDRGVSLSCRLLEIPMIRKKRPSCEEMLNFITQALSDDLPVAFLNLHNGGVINLESYHWVIIVAMDLKTNQVIIYDHGKKFEIDLKLWLSQTKAGGGFAVML